MPRRAIISALIASSLVWLFAVSVLAHRFNVPSADGILYSLPFATAKHPFDFGIPFLDDFDGYGSHWGHHWPGTMWLRGLIFTILPYSRVADVAVLSCFQWLGAFTAACLVWRVTARLFPSLAVLVIVLSDRLLLLACAGNRIEAPAVAATLLMVAATLRQAGSGSRHWNWIGPLAAFFCAASHPYSLALGGVILVLNLAAARRYQNVALRHWLALAIGFALGCAATAIWFLAEPAALHQFRVNMDLQKSFYNNRASVWTGLSNYRLQAGVLLWGMGLIAALAFIARFPRRQSKPGEDPLERLMGCSAILLIAVLAIHTFTRCENFHYLAFGSPFAAILACVFLFHTRRFLPSRLSWMSACAVAMLAFPHALMLPHRLFQFNKAGRPDLHAAYQAILDSVPRGNTIYISHNLWPAAVGDRSHTIRWFTFPIASKWSTRNRYEQLAYSHAKPGDILIVDQGSSGQPDRFGLFPTFDTHPPDPARWKHLRDHQLMFPGAIPWGINLSVFEYRD